jgi:hypothetical protein
VKKRFPVFKPFWLMPAGLKYQKLWRKRLGHMMQLFLGGRSITAGLDFQED